VWGIAGERQSRRLFSLFLTAFYQAIASAPDSMEKKNRTEFWRF
jgi:hypothetical protein